MTADQQSHDRLRSGGSTSRSLLANAKLALPAAWERLVRLYTPFVVACCRRWGVPEQDIGDVLQDVFSAVANHLHRFHKQQAHDTFRGWLVTITRNKVHDYFRRLRAQPAAGGGTEAARRMQQIPDDCAQQEAAGDEEQWAENTRTRAVRNGGRVVLLRALHPAVSFPPRAARQML